MGRAQVLFDEIRGEGEARIDRFIAEKHVEELIIDYKRSADDGATLTTLHDDDKKNLAKAISGFGNSEGGVILWGIECSRDRNGRDIPTTKRPLKDAKRFQSQIERNISGCTIPVHSEVQNYAVVAPDGSGCVATIVPRSSLSPHQVAGDCRYYIRAGSSFVPASHSVLLGLLDRRPAPEPFLMFAFKPASLDRGTAELQIGLQFVHHGPGLLEDCYLHFMPVQLPGDRCEISCGRSREPYWSITTYLDRDFFATTTAGFRLAPYQITQPLAPELYLAGTIDSPFRYEIVLGAKGTPVRRFEICAAPETVAAALRAAQDVSAGEAGRKRLVIETFQLETFADIYRREIDKLTIHSNDVRDILR